MPIVLKAKRVVPICKACGSKDIRKDAYASWDIDEGRWLAECTFDSASCGDCEAEGGDIFIWITLQEEETKE